MTTLTFFGGAFDPPHMGHFLTAAYFLACERKSKLLLVPSGTHPYAKKMAPLALRLAMCKAMVKPLGARVEVLPIEKELAVGTTFDLVQLLKKRYPRARLQMLVGADAYRDRHNWHRANELLAQIDFFAVGRAGMRGEQGHLAMPDVSSTEIRARLAAGKPCEGLVPASVLEMIGRRNAYRRAY